MKIMRVIGREIFDGRGWPTVCCDIVLDTGLLVSASVPSSISRGIFEAHELRDGGSRLFGKGVLQAIDRIESTIAPMLIGKEPNVIDIDLMMLELDKTTNKSYLGANAMLAVSLAVARAQAATEGLELFEFIAFLNGAESVTLPFPLVTVLNGGLLADNNLAIQDYMVVPIGAQNVRQSMEIIGTVYQEIRQELKKRNKKINSGQGGGFAPDLASDYEALDIITQVLDKVGNEQCVIALDMAASTFYDKERGLYRWQEKLYTTTDMVGIYEELITQYPIYSLEDCFDASDILGWQQIALLAEDNVQIAGDAMFASHTDKIAHALEQNLVTAATIKPAHVGTLSETLHTVDFCKKNGLNSIISHRSGETEDTFLVDLAVGISAGQLKAGGFSRSEFVAKYNRLITLEDHLMRQVLGASDADHNLD